MHLKLQMHQPRSRFDVPRSEAQVKLRCCRDQEQLENEIRKNPQFKSATDFQYAFKLRDKNKPNAWYTVDKLTVLPKKEDIEPTIGDKIGAYFQSLRGTVQR